MPEFDTMGARKDGATITPQGDSLAGTIDGVLVRSATTHVDHRGRLFEVVNPAQDPEFWRAPVVHSYVFTIRSLTLKGWGVHEFKADRYCLLEGETTTLLYDGRPGSPTHGLVQQVFLSPQGARKVLIPAGVWHLSINIAPQETFLINFPTEPYHYDAPDRLTLPWNSPEIPVDVSSYLPRQLGAPVDG